MGYPGFSASGYAALLAPAGTPAEAVNRVQAETAKLLKLPAVSERFLTLGLDPVGSTPAEFAQFMRTDLEKWTKLVRELNLTLQ
jgi:tripartite-type tricarboxylate transporter receptor subunit TctC